MVNQNTDTVRQALLRFLEQHKVGKGETFTHTSLQNPGGSFNISDAELGTFYELYKAALNQGHKLHITEKHVEVSPVLIDLDFRQDSGKRQYDLNTIICFSRIIFSYLRDFIVFTNDVEIPCFIMQKKAPRKNKENGYKDGVHLMIPNIVTYPTVQYQIRDRFLKEHPDYFTGFTNDINDIYDEAVIERNNWFLYGSMKPDEEDAWKVTHKVKYRIDIIGGLRSCLDVVKDDAVSYVDTFTIRNKLEVSEHKSVPPPIPKTRKPPQQKQKQNNQNYQKKEVTADPDLQEVKDLVSILSPTRADNYKDWMELGWCLYNINSELLDDWVQFSKKSKKYVRGECERIWSSNTGPTNEGLQVGSLHMWAKADNAFEYKRILNRRVFLDVKNCNGSHNAVAATVFKILKGKYVCATSNGKLWYRFDGALWTIDDDAVRIRNELSTSIREQFLIAMNRVTTSMSIDDLESNASTSTAAKDDKRVAETMLNIAFKLQECGFKDCVLKEMREYFYDPTFIRKLDANQNLLAFTNGVWDLKKCSFRKALAEDYLSMSTGYEYNDKINLQQRERVKRYWESLHPNEEQRNYVLQMFARQLYGDNGCELFHIHSGYLASASNGKTKSFEILESCLGNYVRKFEVELIIAKQRGEAGKPKPEYKYWRGVRILYCTEPAHDDMIHSGIMKDLTGGENVMYRLLYSNDIHEFRPQFKLHIMCNDPPQVDGSDSGVKRRIRKIDYISHFVAKEDVDPTRHKYERDVALATAFKENIELRLEFVRYLLEHYNHTWEFTMPKVIRENSDVYLEENDQVHTFVKKHIVADENSFLTLQQVKDFWYDCKKVKTLKNDLQKLLGVPCLERMREGDNRYRSVFKGYKLVEDVDEQDI